MPNRRERRAAQFGPPPPQPPPAKSPKGEVAHEPLRTGDWVLYCLAAAMGLGQIILGQNQHSSRGMTIILLLAMAAFLTRPVLHLRWLTGAESAFKRMVRTALAIFAMLLMVGALGWFSWPPIRRHGLSLDEKAAFEAPLKAGLDKSISIQLACPASDEVDCVYASNLIPLFGEAGWDVNLDVTRVNLPRPMQGINLVMHASTDFVPKKWNEGVWTKMLPAVIPVDKAFVAIGIEPDSNSGFSVAENQIIVYVGPERDDESAPTQFTQTVSVMEQTENDRLAGRTPDPNRTPGAK
jgi:hypothetical protein